MAKMIWGEILIAAIFSAVTAVGAEITPRVSEQIGSWRFENEVDPMSDKKSASITLKAGKNEFAFQCDEPGHGKVYPIFVADQYLGGRGGGYDRRRIMLRFDTDPTIEATWVYKGSIAFIPDDPGQAQALIARAATAQKLAVRALTYDGNSVDAVFEIVGTQQALAKLAQACAAGDQL